MLGLETRESREERDAPCCPLKTRYCVGSKACLQTIPRLARPNINPHSQPGAARLSLFDPSAWRLQILSFPESYSVLPLPLLFLEETCGSAVIFPCPQASLAVSTSCAQEVSLSLDWQHDDRRSMSFMTSPLLLVSPDHAASIITSPCLSDVVVQDWP